MKKGIHEFANVAEKVEVTTDIHDGRIIFYNEVRKFGYLHDVKENQDYFFHISGVNYCSIKAYDFVSFSIDKYKGRTCAIDINRREDGE